MPIIPTSVWDKYRELSALFIEEVNKTVITLHYTQNTVTTTNNSTDFALPNIDAYGGRSPVDSIDGRLQEEGNHVIENDRTESITVRFYWTTNKIYDKNKNINILDSKNIAKIICYSNDADKLRNAKYISVTQSNITYKLGIVIPPIFYGMNGNKNYSISFWEVINA